MTLKSYKVNLALSLSLSLWICNESSNEDAGSSDVLANRAFRVVSECEESSIADKLQPTSQSQILRRLHWDWTQSSWSIYGTTKSTGYSTAYGTDVGIAGTADCLKILTNSVGLSPAH